jgi:hypothetical protein
MKIIKEEWNKARMSYVSVYLEFVCLQNDYLEALTNAYLRNGFIKDHAYYNRNKEDINKSNTYFLLAGLH